MYGLTSQIRRAASSIAANIAEGCGRDTSPQLRNFLEISLGSASELEYHILLAHDLKMLEVDAHRSMDAQVTEVKKMLVAFIQKIKAEK
jgi:four helix bundle protein